MKQEVVRINKSKSGKGGPQSKGINPADWSMDKVEYSADALTEAKWKTFETKQETSTEGAIFIVDLVIEGAKYRDGLTDANEKTLIYKMPPIEMSAKTVADPREANSDGHKAFYNCPLYKYPMRSDDYLIAKIPLKIPGQSKDTSAANWMLKGVALLCYYEI